MYSYSAYGLNIESEIDLGERESAFESVDLTIRRTALNKSEMEVEFEGTDTFERPHCKVRMTVGKTLCYWTELGTTIVRGGNEIVIDPLSGIGEADFVPIITGALLGNLLHQRGLFVLHGSSLIINGEAVAFLGDKGAGKSTLAVHLYNRGHFVMSDDLVPICFSDERAITYPGFPRIKLWPDSLESLGVEPDDFPKISRFIDKRSVECEVEKNQEAMELNRIYVLNVDSEINIAAYSPGDAFIELARHTYLNRYLNATDSTLENFRQCELVTKSVPVLRLNRPHDFNKLSEIPVLIEKDINSRQPH